MTRSLHTLALLLIVFCLLLSLAPAQAAPRAPLGGAAPLVTTTITLTTGNDEAVSDSVLSLREALDFANYTKNTCYTSGEKNAIVGNGWSWYQLPPGACLGAGVSPRWEPLMAVMNYGHVTIQVGSGITDLWENSALPHFPGNITLDGTSGGGKARLVKGGSYTGNGLEIQSGAVTVYIRHLRIEGFSGAGLSALSTPDGGLKDAAFTDLEIHDNGGDGMIISSFTQNWASSILIGGPSLAERNLIYGNGGNGIVIEASAQYPWTAGIGIRGNLIGMDGAGNARGNGGNGIFLNNVHDVTVGGPDNFSRNLIYFNGGDGIKLTGNSWQNTLANNVIGLETTAPNPDGGNHGAGITLLGAVSFTTIQGNDITGNDGVAGIYVSGVGADHNSILYNIVGMTFEPGTGNLGDGILIADSAWQNTVSQNQIGSSGHNGLHITANAGGTLVESNLIGVNGNAGFANAWHGILLDGGAHQNQVGTAGKGNFIGNSGRDGIHIADPGTTQNSVLANTLGQTDRGYGAANLWSGIAILNQATDNSIGAFGAGNTIMHGAVGVYIANPGTVNNRVYANTIGTTAYNGTGLGSLGAGVFIGDLASGNTIGAPGQSNVISGNGGPGVDISNASLNTVANNWIGTNGSGTAALANLQGGVRIRDGAQNNTIGPDNTISGNTGDGVWIDTNSSGNMVRGNIIGLNSAKTAKIANTGSGVSIYNYSHLNTVGWPGAPNIIAGNGGAGVLIADPGANDNRIVANFIGITDASVCTLGNGGDGVIVFNGASGDQIGDSVDPARGNVISCNAGSGVHIWGAGTQQIGVYGNKIGVDAQALSARPNGGAGVTVNAANYVTIGNPFGASAPYQVISANLGQGIYALDTHYLIIDSGQAIGNDSGSPNMGNHLEGILLENTQNSLVQPSFIQLSGGAGIAVIGSNSNNNRLLPLWDLENGGLAIDLGNDGFTPNDPGDLDSGPNGLLNYPAITRISGLTLFGTACGNCTIRVYWPIGNPTQPYGGFNALSGPLVVTTSDASGHWSATLPAGSNPHNVMLQAVQTTDPLAFTNTSELSPIVPWITGLPVLHR